MPHTSYPIVSTASCGGIYFPANFVRLIILKVIFIVNDMWLLQDLVQAQKAVLILMLFYGR